jgi:hypothetical protein
LLRPHRTPSSSILQLLRPHRTPSSSILQLLRPRIAFHLLLPDASTIRLFSI